MSAVEAWLRESIIQYAIRYLAHHLNHLSQNTRHEIVLSICLPTFVSAVNCDSVPLVQLAIRSYLRGYKVLSYLLYSHSSSFMEAHFLFYHSLPTAVPFVCHLELTTGLDTSYLKMRQICQNSSKTTTQLNP